jgi:hypothetical protein
MKRNPVVVIGVDRDGAGRNNGARRRLAHTTRRGVYGNFARTGFSELRPACPHCCRIENGDSSTGNDEPGTPQGAIHPYGTHCKREVVL